MKQNRTLQPPIYLDNQATTPTDPRVVDAMLPFFTERFGNPHSIQHAVGRSVAEAVETARAQVASLIGAEPREIVFTSGATESNNLAIKGAARFARRYKALDHIVTIETEHKCVLESCRRLEEEGFSVTILPVGPSGHVDFDALEDAITDRTALVSVMAAQNEVGVLAPLEEIGDITRARGILFHSDAAQAIGKVPLDVNASKIDLLSISGHKAYGPMGIGALYVRRRPRARLEPLIDGGGQERGLRSGTVAPALCVGLGTACALAEAEMTEEAARVEALRDRLLDRLRATVPDLFVNGDLERRLPGNLNFGVPGIDSEALISALARDGVPLIRVGVHLRFGRAVLRPAGDGAAGNPGRGQPSGRCRPVYDGGGYRRCGQCHCRSGPRPAKRRHCRRSRIRRFGQFS